MKSVFALVLVILNSSYLLAQCPSIDFTIPVAACKNAELSPPTTISNAASFSWDFCDGSIANAPVSTQALNTAGISNAYDLTAVEENDNHSLFAVDYGDGTNGSGEIWRFDFGADLSSTPSVTDLGYFGVIQRPLGIGFWKENGNSYGLVVTEGGQLYRLTFGNSIINFPSVTQITGLTGLSDHRHIKIISENGSILAIIAGGNTTNISILNFGSSIENQPTRTFVTVPATGNVSSLDLVIECSNRYILASGYGSGLHLVSFGNSFLNPAPTFSQPAGFTSGSMLGLSVVKSDGQYYAIVSSQSIGIVRANFGSYITNPNPQRENLGVFNSVNFGIGHEIVKNKTNYYSASININGRLSILEFPKDCSVVEDFFGNATPVVSFDEPGTYSVTLSATGSDGEIVTVTKDITISNDIAPSFVIIEDGACVDSQVTFVGQQANGGAVSGLSWDFGDGAQGAGQNAPHQYSSIGMYTVVLSATSANGCVNRVESMIQIYNAPVASFILPTGIHCTNNELTFINATPDNYNGELTYSWKVDNQFASLARDLNHSFSTTGNHNIDLIASIPGCTSPSSRIINIQEQGPLVDFSATTGCQGAALQFTNNTSGSGLVYSWDFGDGNSSPAANPTNTYMTFGNFNATLHADNGVCNNSATKPITIYSKPQPDFSLDLPPFSCQGTPSQFNDLTPNPTDSNLSSWAWDFGDAANGSSTQRNPLYTYSAAGPYSVSLDVTTNFGCNATVQKMVAITTAPPINFTNAPACVNQPTQFTDASGSGVKSWLWKIDNSTYSINNPVHTFTTAGSHNVELTITGANDCIGQMTKTVMVPVATTPDFSVENACSEKPTAFIDITGGADPVITRNWDFAGLGSASGASTTYTFPIGGNYTVKLNTTHQSGCAYLAAKSITIGTSPTSLFTSSAEGGPPPLTIKFSNSSTGAGSYLWKFNDKANTTSLLAEPSFTFNELGDYQVELTSFGQQGCADTFSKPIRIVEPKTDLSLISLELLSDPTSGSLRPVVTIKNNGNIAVTNVNILMDLSGGGSIKEKMQINLQPSQTFTQALVSELLPKGLSYICAEVKLENDENLFDNKICSTLADEVILFAPYPNPSQGQLHIDWIAASGDVANIVIFNSTGGNAYDKEITASQPGLSQIILDISALGPGIYFAVFSYGDFTKTHRFMVN